MTLDAKKRIVIFISGSGSNMEVLIDKAQSRELCANVLAVFSDKAEAAGLQKAAKKGVPHYVFPYNQPNRAAAEHKMAEAAENLNAEYLILAGFMRVLSPAFVARFERRIINIHPSLLPAYKGAKAIEDALADGAQKTGVTIHWVNEFVDDGEIIAQQPVDISPTDDQTSLAEKIHAAEHELYWRTLNDLFTKSRV